MTTKNFFGGAIINYGSVLPSVGGVPDGALFFKTGTSPGIYIFSLNIDANSTNLGNQPAQTWQQLVSTASSGSDAASLGGQPASAYYRNNLSGLSPTTADPTASFWIDTTSPAIKSTVNTASLPGNFPSTTGATWTFLSSMNLGGTVDNYQRALDLHKSYAGAAHGFYLRSYSSAGIPNNWERIITDATMGPGSGLDADLLDGEDGLFYRNASNINAGTLATARGGTGVSHTSLTQGAVMYAASATTIQDSAVGAATSGSGTNQNWQVLTSGGGAAPAWVNSTGLNVAFATNAAFASSATTATTATTALTANAVAWTGITGLPSAQQSWTDLPAAGFDTRAGAALFYDMGNIAALSMNPSQFVPGTLSGFDAYSTSDMGQYQVGLTVVGLGGAGRRAVQLAANWNFEEAAPSGLRFRVNDDTGTAGAWGAFRTLWDNGNLNALSQLTNDQGFITGASLANYLDKTTATAQSVVSNVTFNNDISVGDRATANSLAVTGGAGIGGVSIPGVGSLNVGANILAFGNISAQGNLNTTDNVYASGGSSGIVAYGASGMVHAGVSAAHGGGGGSGAIRMQGSGSANSGYIEFYASNGTSQTRTSYIGTSTFSTQDAGTLTYSAGLHSFAGDISTNGNVTAYSSDARLKENVTVIPDAIKKVKKLGGYEFDWKERLCEQVGFQPAQRHEHGLLAQEVEQVMPDAVTAAAFNSDYKTVRYERLVALLVAAINEQQEQIAALQQQVTELANGD